MLAIDLLTPQHALCPTPETSHPHFGRTASHAIIFALGEVVWHERGNLVLPLTIGRSPIIVKVKKFGEGMIKEGSGKWNGSLKRWYLIPHHLETALGLPTSVWAFIRAKPSVKPEC